MTAGIRESGIDVLGPVPWGTHFCLFYQTKQDLIDVIIPYVKAGLENNEFCMWVTSEPFEAGEARARMAEAVPDFATYLERGQIEILPYDQWYVIDGVFNSKRVLNGWVDKLKAALARGFSGLRLTGNTFWLEKADWKDFLDYEQDVNDTVGQHSMIALCTYSLDRCGAYDILDVVSTHQFALSRQEGGWKVIESKEQAEARRALRESEVRFRSLIQNSSDIIRILDREGRIIYDSPSSERILGYPSGSLLGRSPMDFIHPDDLELVRSSLSSIYAGTNPGTPTEFRILKADGEYLDVESTGSNMIGVPGVDGIVITTRPITERKRAEKELEEAKLQAELYLDLMGHDISNMHQIMMMQLELAGETLEHKGKLEGRDREVLDSLAATLEKAARLIDNVRKLQKLNSGEYALEPVDLGVVLPEVLKMYSGLPGRDIAITFSGCEGSLVQANLLLKDVFMNLLDNAVKHSAGPLDIAVDVRRVVSNGPCYYRVAIEDNGKGIPDEKKEEVFQRFKRGQTKAKGTGLGLYLVRSLVEGFGGRVEVENRVPGDYGKGTRFSVYLPAIDEAL
ncbi:MEDS domain-containing protein [Methanocella sp. MCL-LM]|uniref:MEDS domain-containing protein n=1 Tax=Methanocella sp. MCL-LM TaxID=3412035 RepID=UPI003C744731